jgi:5-formyltetrahydrofolate cyclo-ligase
MVSAQAERRRPDPHSAPWSERRIRATSDWVPRNPDPPPLYRQVCQHLEALALGQPFDDVSALPPEVRLCARLGVSRGTLRRATDELAREGLLRIEPGRGTFVDKATQLRWCGWERLAEVARPDSRFDLDISRFVPDFSGREECDRLVIDLDAFKRAEVVFVAPDNSLLSIRETTLGHGKRMIVPTCWLRRGLICLDGATVPSQSHPLAASLDGMERFGRQLDLADLRALGRIDLVLTGAVAVTHEGVHIDPGTGMFALEWALMAQLGLVDQNTPVIASVHSCQVVDAVVTPTANDAVVDLIATPTGIHECTGPPKSTEVRFGALRHGLVDTVSYLRELVADGGLPPQPVRRAKS